MNISKIQPKHLLIFLCSAAFLALLLAYITQYLFGLAPCQICFWQRKPFFAIVILSILFLFVPFLKKNQNLANKIIVFLLIVNAAIAFYHIGVENKIFSGPNSCSSSAFNSNSLQELKMALEKAPSVNCGKPALVFLKISMAGWNLIYCLSLALIAIVLLRKLNFKNES